MSGFDALVVVAQGLTYRLVTQVCERLFECRWCIENLDFTVPENERLPAEQTYAIRTRQVREAHPETESLDAVVIARRRLLTMTLLERLLCEIKFYAETRDHLDRETTTLCSGSRDDLGLVPSVAWRKSETTGYLYVRCERPNERHPQLRARLVGANGSTIA